MIKHPKFIVAIGASAGGLNALVEMVQTLQKGLDVAYCIVLHLCRKGIGDFIVHRLKKWKLTAGKRAINLYHPHM